MAKNEANAPQTAATHGAQGVGGILPDRFGRLPAEMRNAARWLVWKSIPQDNGKKPRKVPYYVDGTRRSGTLDTQDDWAKLATFHEAVAALGAGGYTGLGFALGPDGSGLAWQGIDLDHLREHHELKDVTDDLPGFVEASPSGDGLHAIGYGRAFAALGSNATGIEAYCGGRFFTVTGKHVQGIEPVDLAEFVEAKLRPRHSPNRPAKAPSPRPRSPTVIVGPKLLGDLREALSYIEADDYDTWTRIGHALKTLGDAGLELWHEWSATSGKYRPEEAEAKWVGFRPERTSHAAIFAEAQRNGWRNPAARLNHGEVEGGHTEEGLALAFARENEAGLRYCAAWGQWLTWDSVRWVVDKTLLATDRTRDLCRRTATGANERTSAILGQARTVNAIERLARSDRRLAASADQWDADPWLLNTPDGVVDLKTGLLHPGDPALHMTKVTGAAPGGDCPTWLRFLDRVTGGDIELQAYVQRMLGYALTGDTSAHALFFAHGTGANGKSVLIDTAAGVLGDYHRTAPIETFTESNGDRHSTELAMLQGARLVTAVETEEGRRWAESRIKTLTGGDRIAARFMRQDFFEYTPQFKLFIAGNHKPGLRSVDEAMRRRFHLLPFAITIPPEERDAKLKEKLRSEWPGILAWMIQGCLEWQCHGLVRPSAVRSATEAYMEAEDSLSGWIDEKCERDRQAWETSGDLFASWKVWADMHGERAGTARRFTQALEARGFHPQRTREARGVAGLRLRRELEFE